MVIANELIDSFPVHIFQIVNRTPMEVFITENNGNLQEIIQKPSTNLIEGRLKSTIDTLPNGYRGAVCPYIHQWVKEVSRIIKQGVVLLFDYGFNNSTLYDPKRIGRTVQSFYKHTQTHRLLDNPGCQDITAYVDFTSVNEAFLNSGFKHAFTMTQSEFLNRLGLENWLKELYNAKLEQRIRISNATSMRKLLNYTTFKNFKAAAYTKQVICELPEQNIKLPPAPLILESNTEHIDFTNAWSVFYSSTNF